MRCQKLGVVHGEKSWREVRREGHGCEVFVLLSLLSYQLSKVGYLDHLPSIFYPSLDMGFSTSLYPKVGQNFYISSVEIWCIGSKKKKEERVLLIISSVEINILLFFSFSLRVS